MVKPGVNCLSFKRSGAVYDFKFDGVLPPSKAAEIKLNLKADGITSTTDQQKSGYRYMVIRGKVSACSMREIISLLVK